MTSVRSGFVSAAELRQMLGVSETTLRRWIQAGRLPDPRIIGRKSYWSDSVISEVLGGKPALRPGEQDERVAEKPIGRFSADPCGKKGGERQ